MPDGALPPTGGERHGVETEIDEDNWGMLRWRAWRTISEMMVGCLVDNDSEILLRTFRASAATFRE